MSLVTKMISAILCILAFSSGASPQAISTSSLRSSFKLGYVKNGDIGCGCYFARNKAELQNRRYLYIHGMDESAYINVNGKNIKLHRFAPIYEPIREKIGQRSWGKFTAGNIKIRLEKTVTKICDPNDEDCEVTNYKATMTVTKKAQKIIVKLIGLCGC